MADYPFIRDMKKVVDTLSKAGISFVPVPVRGDQDPLLNMLYGRIDELEKEGGVIETIKSLHPNATSIKKTNKGKFCVIVEEQMLDVKIVDPFPEKEMWSIEC